MKKFAIVHHLFSYNLINASKRLYRVLTMMAQTYTESVQNNEALLMVATYMESLMNDINAPDDHPKAYIGSSR